MKYFYLAILLLAVHFGYADILYSQQYPGDIVSDWAAGTAGASASGYNNGSIMNAGRHWQSADDFILPGQEAYAIQRLDFVCGTDLNAEVMEYRVVLYESAGAGPEGSDILFMLTEDAGLSSGRIFDQMVFAGGDKDRAVHYLSVDTSGMGLILNGSTTYYVSIEGDCENTENIYNGYDTYYQRFYMLKRPGGDMWYRGEYETGFSDWQKNDGDALFTINGVAVPEPASAVLVLAGVGLLRKRSWYR